MPDEQSPRTPLPAVVWRRFVAFLDSLGPLDGSDPAADAALEAYVQRLQRLAARPVEGLRAAWQRHDGRN